jgi:hypothetical protein
MANHPSQSDYLVPAIADAAEELLLKPDWIPWLLRLDRKQAD